MSTAIVGDGGIDASRPKPIYEPAADRRLVGVEFIVDAATWLAHHPPPVLGARRSSSSTARTGTLPAFFELHVWAWQDNPGGAFVDWNTRVTCEGQ